MTSYALPNLIESCAVSDAFCTDLARIERVGPCVRLVFSVRQGAPHDDTLQTENIVIAKLVLPADALPRIASLPTLRKSPNCNWRPFRRAR